MFILKFKAHFTSFKVAKNKNKIIWCNVTGLSLLPSLKLWKNRSLKDQINKSQEQWGLLWSTVRNNCSLYPRLSKNHPGLLLGTIMSIGGWGSLFIHFISPKVCIVCNERHSVKSKPIPCSYLNNTCSTSAIALLHWIKTAVSSQYTHLKHYTYHHHNVLCVFHGMNPAVLV